MSGIVVFGGTAHPRLSEQICLELDLALSPSSVKRFSNDCMQVQLEANCREADVYLIQPLSPPVHDHLMELLQMLDAARGASVARVTAVIPYYAYARSDKKDAPRISIAGRLTADLLQAAGASRILTMALHAPQVHGFFSVPVDHLNALHVLAGQFRNRDLSNTVVVAPDFGRAKDAHHVARLLRLPVAVGAKERISDDRVVISTIVGDVSGKDAIVVDDEIATGGTIVELIGRMREHGVSKVSLVCTHGLFTGPAMERLKSCPEIVEIVTTDTVSLPADRRPSNLVTLTVAPLMAEAIRRIHHGESVSSLFSAPGWVTGSDQPSAEPN